MNLLILLVFLGCLGTSFLLSGMESGVFALSRLRIRQRMNNGDKRAAALYRYLENPEDFLWTILVGNTLANLTAFSIGVCWLYSWPDLPRLLLWLLVLAAGILFYGLIELLPKMLIQFYPTRLCTVLVGPFRMIDLALYPVVAAVAVCSRLLLRWSGGRRFTGDMFGNREEFRRVMQESAHGLTTEERSMIDRVLNMQNLTLGQIAIPMKKAVTVKSRTPMREVLAVCREHDLSRLPVLKGSGDNRRVIGLVSLNPLIYRSDLDPAKPVSEYVKPVLRLDHGARLEDALRLMQSRRQRLAVVMAPDQTEMGVVSLQDILRCMFGEVSL